MTDEQAMGMWMGLFIGDAAGVPYEFMPPSRDGSYKFFSFGGVHNASVGEWSDDGAMLWLLLVLTYPRRGSVPAPFKRTLSAGSSVAPSEQERACQRGTLA